MPQSPQFVPAAHPPRPGRSVLQGGRVVCQVAADLPALALACVLLSYPLHPPGAPQQLRDAPLALLTLPLLLVRGTRDEFSTQEQWEALLPRLQSAMLEVCWLLPSKGRLAGLQQVWAVGFEEPCNPHAAAPVDTPRQSCRTAATDTGTQRGGRGPSAQAHQERRGQPGGAGGCVPDSADLRVCHG